MKDFLMVIAPGVGVALVLIAIGIRNWLGSRQAKGNDNGTARDDH